MAAIVLGGAFMAAMTLIVIAARHVIPLVFLGLGTDSADPTLQLAAVLLLVGATFFVADGVQTVAGGALRGLNDTRTPLLFAAVCFWAIGFTTCYALGFTWHYGAPGIWIGLSLGLAVYALLLIWRFHALTRRGYLPDIATPS
jgi:MATE family multidrug resistance protein